MSIEKGCNGIRFSTSEAALPQSIASADVQATKEKIAAEIPEKVFMAASQCNELPRSTDYRP